MNTEKVEVNLKPLYGFIYFAWLLVTWTFYVVFIYPVLSELVFFSSKTLGEFFRILIFAVPVLFVSYKVFSNPLEKLGITTNIKKGLIVGLTIAIVWFSVSLALESYVQNNQFEFTKLKLAFFFTGFSTSTIIEELAFRSFLLQSLKSINIYFAIIASSLAFVFIHFPGWIIFEIMPNVTVFLSASVSIFILGCVLAVVLIRTRSIWSVIIIHSFNNLAAIILAAK